MPKNYHRGTVCFFVSFGYRKLLGIRKKVIHVFRSKTFCLTVPKKFVGEPFYAVYLTTSGIEKIHGEEGGEPRFPVEYFWSHIAEKFLNGKILCFTKLPLSKNIKDKEGVIHIFPSKTFQSHGAEKNHRGTLL